MAAISVGPIRIAIVGVGKIARDQHIPSISDNADFELVATVSSQSGLDDIANFKTLKHMLEQGPELDAVALCTPPSVRHELALLALEHRKHVLLEKPPGATLSEIDDLTALADQDELSLFATWHSRFAAAVQPAKHWLQGKQLRRATILWKEDVRHWHPGQEWIWDAGGFGVFDPGINALSIITEILPRPIFIKDATLLFPENRAAPIAADMNFTDSANTPIRFELDWRQTGPQTWDIEIETDQGTLLLQKGGSVMSIDDNAHIEENVSEYDGIYRRFADLIKKRESDVDVRPLRHVADAFMRGHHLKTEAFIS